MSVLNYKKDERAKEVDALEKSIAPLKKKKLDIQTIEKIELKTAPFSSKVTLSQEDYTALSTAAKKWVVREKKERRLEKSLKTAEKTISELEAQNSKLSRELSGFRSVKGQLDKGKLQQENADLRDENSRLKAIVEQNGLAHLLGRGRKEKETNHDVR